jgi:hypothetical protein
MILGRRVEYFDELLNANVSDQSEDTGIKESHEDRGIVELPPTIAQVEAAIDKCKNNKAPGMHSIQIKHAGVEHTKSLHQLIG